MTNATVTIKSEESVSTAFRINEAADLSTKVFPSSMFISGWTAAPVSFEATLNGTDWFTVYDGASVYSVTVDENTVVRLKESVFKDLQRVRLRSGVPGTYVDQDEARAVVVRMSAV